MLWIGAIFGALFGWIGILVAAHFWATLAIIKLLLTLNLFAAQLIIGANSMITRAIVYIYRRITSRNTTSPAAPRTKKAFMPACSRRGLRVYGGSKNPCEPRISPANLDFNEPHSLS